MNYTEWKNANKAAKERTFAEWKDKVNKNQDIRMNGPFKTTKNAKSGEKTVKTPISIDIEAKIHTSEAVKRYIGTPKRTESTPDPNKAFKAKTRSVDLAKTKEILDYIRDIEEEEEDWLWET